MPDSADRSSPFWLTPIRATWPLALAIVIAAILHFFVRPYIGEYQSNLLLFAGINIILAVSLTVVNGFAGQFSIGHAGFMSVGGYVAAAIVYYGSFRIWNNVDFHGGLLSWTGIGAFHGPLIGSGDLLFLGACLLGGIFAMLIGWVVGLPSLRLRGDYLAIVTLGFGEIVRVVLQGTQEQFYAGDADAVHATGTLKLFNHLGGALGFIGIPTYATVFWVWLVVIITLAATIRLKRSSYGRALLSVREDEIAAQAMGVNITRYKVRAFMFGAFFAGVAGALYGMQIGSINSGDLAFLKSFDIVIMVVLGGLGSVSGAALAAVLLTLLPELLRDPPSIWPWGLVIAIIIAALIWLLAPRRLGPLIVLASLCVGWEAMRWAARKIGINLSDYRMILYSLTLIVIMIVRPQGLFGIREIWDYFPIILRRFGWRRAVS